MLLDGTSGYPEDDCHNKFGSPFFVPPALIFLKYMDPMVQVKDLNDESIQSGSFAHKPAEASCYAQ